MQPSPPVLPGAGGNTRDYMLAYLACGFSVIPLNPPTPSNPKAQKRPVNNMKWGTYQKRQPTEKEINDWTDNYPTAGIGVVCGEVSGYAYCYDVDNEPFAAWLKQNALQDLISTGMWINETGRGMPHLWVRSRKLVYSKGVTWNGEHLADIRGEGSPEHGASYMVVPPTLHPSGIPYRTIAGSFENLPWIEDANVLFERVRDMWLSSTGGEVPPPSYGPIPGGSGRTEPLALTPDEVQKARAQVAGCEALSTNVRRALLNGAKYGEGVWVDKGSNSEIDHRVLMELYAAGFSDDDIERIYAASPLGNNRYNGGNGSSGRAYLDYSLGKARRQTDKERAAQNALDGPNYRVEKVVYVPYEKPVYRITFILQDGAGDEKEITAEFTAAQLLSYHSFQEVCWSQKFHLLLKDIHVGRKWTNFGLSVMNMAQMATMPKTATNAGHMRYLIFDIISKNVRMIDKPPENASQVGVGWREPTVAWVRPGELIQKVQMRTRPSPAPDRIWEALEAIGATEEGYRFPDGDIESLWRIPTERALPAWSPPQLPGILRGTSPPQPGLSPERLDPPAS